MQPLSGSIVALVTPFQPDGQVDYAALRKLVDWHIEQGTDCIGVVGTTGESPTVNVDEHVEIIRVTVEQFQLGDYFNEVFAKKYGIVFVSLPSFDDWRDVTGMVSPEALWNVFGTEDPALDKLIDEARTTTGDQQDAAFQGIGKYLLDNAWYAPWATPNVIYATNDTVSVQLSPGQIEPLIWDIKPID